jgi:phage terminase small subunit
MTATEKKQRKFAQEYVKCNNIVQSALKAGYTESYANAGACKLLENVRVAGYIKQYSKEIEKKAQEELEKNIMTAAERQALLSDIAQDEDNTPTDRIRAVDTLNKMTGEYTVKVDSTVRTSDKLADVFKQLGGEGLEE